MGEAPRGPSAEGSWASGGGGSQGAGLMSAEQSRASARAENRRSGGGGVAPEYSRDRSASPDPASKSTHNWNRPEPLGKPVIKHSRVKKSTGKYNVDGVFTGSVHPENMSSEPSTDPLPSETSSKHLELMKKWDAKRKAAIKKKSMLTPVGRGNMRTIMEKREKEKDDQEEKEHKKEVLRKETKRLKDLNFFQDLGKACFKESQYEPESNFGIEARLSFFEWLTPTSAPAASSSSRRSKDVRTRLKAQKQANHSLSARIPDTVVWGLRSDGKPSWFFTAPDGTIRRTDKITDEDIIQRIGNRACMGALVAVVKRQALDQSGCEVDILSTVELQELVLSPSRRRGLVAVQRFVKARGNHATFIRTAWHSAKLRKAPKAWMFSNKALYEDPEEKNNQSVIPGVTRKPKVEPVYRFLVHSTKMHSCSVDEMKGNLCEEAARLNEKIARFLAVERGILVDELVVDYIRDEYGKLWMLQVHALTVSTLSKRCEEFDRLPGENSQTTAIAKRTARTRPESREQSRQGTASRDGLDASGVRCSLTGARILEGRKVDMKPKDIAVIHDRRSRRGAKGMHFLGDAASASRMMTPEEMTSLKPFTHEVRDLMVSELKLERLQRDLNRLLGLQEIRCTVEEIQEQFDEHTRPATDLDETASMASMGSMGSVTLSSQGGSSVNGDGEPGAEGEPAGLPKTYDCYRLLVCISSFENLEESSLTSWIEEGASSQIEVCAAQQATIVDQSFKEGHSSSQNRKLRALYFWADSDNKDAWLGPGGGMSTMYLNMHDAASGSLVATSAIPLGEAILEALASGVQDKKTDPAILQIVQRTPLYPRHDQENDYHAEAMVLITLEKLGTRRPRRSRPAMPHAKIWIPAPGFCTPDPLPTWWLELLALRTGESLRGAVSEWHKSSLECAAGGPVVSPSQDLSLGLEGSGNQADAAGPDESSAVDIQDGTQPPPAEAAGGEVEEMHPALAVMSTAKAVLEAPEGDIALETAIRGLLSSSPAPVQQNGDSQDSQVLPASRLGQLLAVLLQGCENWEGEIFQALVSLSQVENLGAEQILAEVKACTLALEDALGADQEMATLAAVVAHIPPYELRRDFVAACEATEATPGVLDFQGLALFLRSVLPAADAAAIRQLIMQLCLIGPDGTFSISFDEFRMACEAIPIAENQGLDVAWTEGSQQSNGPKEEQLPGIPSAGALLVTWANYQAPASPANSDAAELPTEKPLVIQVFAYYGPLDTPQEPWIIGPVTISESGEVHMVGEEGDSTECFLVDGIQLDAGSHLPSLEIQVLDAEDNSILAVAFCNPAQFLQLLDGLHEQGLLQQLPADDHGHCMEQTAALWRPNVDPALIDVQPEGDEVSRAVLMLEFIPLAGADPSNSADGTKGSSRQQSGTVPELQPSRSQISNPNQEAQEREAQKPPVDPEAMEDWKDRAQHSSQVAELLQGSGLGDLIPAICCELKAVRPEDLADFELGLPEAPEPGIDRWDRLKEWLAQQGAMVTPEEALRLRALVESLPPRTTAAPAQLIRELEMVDGTCTRPLSEVASDRWITPSIQAALSLGMPELSWEDLVLVEPSDLQAELLDAGHNAFDVRAVIQLLGDYNKAQAACVDEEVRQELIAQGYALSPRDTGAQPMGGLTRTQEACETIEEERTEDLEMEEREDPGSVDGIQEAGPQDPPAAANAEDGGGYALDDGMQPLPAEQNAPEANESSGAAGGIPASLHTEQQAMAEENLGPGPDITGANIAGDASPPYGMQQQRSVEFLNDDGIEEIEMEPPPPAAPSGYGRAPEESRDGSRDGGGAEAKELPAWLRD